MEANANALPNLRPARLEFKTTPATKHLLNQAAALDGLDLTAFVMASAIDKARQVISDHASITLSRQGQLALVQLLTTPVSPTPAMKNLMSLPDLPVRAA
ncbi:MAG TPA: DUF1778 domain-containing protein [Rhodanobacter sp.]